MALGSRTVCVPLHQQVLDDTAAFQAGILQCVKQYETPLAFVQVLTEAFESWYYITNQDGEQT